MNAYGSARDGGRGKACKNMRDIYLLRSGEYMPLLISLPPTSIKPFKEFLNRAFVYRRRATYGSLIQIGLKKENNGSNDYSVATFRLVRDFQGEELAQIRAYAVTDAVKNVTCEKPEVFNPQGETHIVLMHYGCKRNIVRCLVKRGCKVTVMPAFATAEEVAALDPDGIMLSNGPGDPAEPVEVIENLKHIFELNIPTFGICLGHQLSALAAGAKTMKLKYGHRGANQPVTDFESGRTFITSQNHGYAVVGDELPAEMGEVAQVNANDGTCEGIKYKKWNCFTVQFHPEANGGPKDTEFLFDRFLNNVKAAKKEAR